MRRGEGEVAGEEVAGEEVGVEEAMHLHEDGCAAWHDQIARHFVRRSGAVVAPALHHLGVADAVAKREAFAVSHDAHATV